MANGLWLYAISCWLSSVVSAKEGLLLLDNQGYDFDMAIGTYAELQQPCADKLMIFPVPSTQQLFSGS